MIQRGAVPSGTQGRTSGSHTPASDAKALQPRSARRRVMTRAVRLDEELEQRAQRVRELERLADDEHKKAQAFNKAQRFDEAKAAYARMHELEDQASQLAKELGCVECILGDPSCQASMQASQEFFEPQPLVPWPDPPEGLSRQDWQAQLASRAQSAIAGSLLADAAAMGVHWVYDLDLLESYKQERRQAQTQAQIQQRSSANGSASDNTEHSPSRTQSESASVSEEESVVGLEFMQPPRSPFYSYPSGRNSPYGEQTLVLLRSIAKSQGLDCIHYANAFSDYFGDGFDGYRDVSTKGFLRNFARGLAPPATGAPDAQANCIARTAPLAAGWCGQPEPLARAVRLGTRVTQNADAAVVWGGAAADILSHVILGVSPSQATRMVIAALQHAARAGTEDNTVQQPTSNGSAETSPTVVDLSALQAEVAKQLQQALTLAPLTVTEAVSKLGRNCHLPNCATTPLHAALHIEYLARRAHAAPGAAPPDLTSAELPWSAELATAVGTRYTHGVRAAIAEGGCCASRASYTGAVLGALAGVDGLPAEWTGQYTVWSDVCETAQRIVERRGEL